MDSFTLWSPLRDYDLYATIQYVANYVEVTEPNIVVDRYVLT